MTRLKQHPQLRIQVSALLDEVENPAGALNTGDYQARTLTVEIYRCGSAIQDAALAQLCKTLSATETCFPATDRRPINSQVGAP